MNRNQSLVPVAVQPSFPGEVRQQGLVTTFMIASAMSVGANLVDVRQGRRSVSHALINGFAKGAVSTMILSGSKPDSPVKVAGTIGLLAGAGYIIDSIMENPEKSTPSPGKKKVAVS